jgi:hypothetical protein
LLRGQNHTAEKRNSPSAIDSAAPIVHSRTARWRSVRRTAAATVASVAAPSGGSTSFGVEADMNSSALVSDVGTSAKMFG